VFSNRVCQPRFGAVTDGIAKVVAISVDARYFLVGDSTPHILKTGMILKSGHDRA